MGLLWKTGISLCDLSAVLLYKKTPSTSGLMWICCFRRGGNEYLQFTITSSKRVNVYICLIYSALCKIVFIKKYYPCE